MNVSTRLLRQALRSERYWSKANYTAIGAALAAVVLGGPAVAEEGTDRLRIEEVIVTATRKETNLMETPISVWAIDGDELEAKGDLDIKTLYQSIPSMSYTANSETWNTISVRGLSNYAAGSSMVSVYFDEIPVTDQTSGGLRQIPGAFFDLERVEVLRGRRCLTVGSKGLARGGRQSTATTGTSRDTRHRQNPTAPTSTTW
jgi:outer membrane receptor protein involved in Fe transport